MVTCNRYYQEIVHEGTKDNGRGKSTKNVNCIDELIKGRINCSINQSTPSTGNYFLYTKARKIMEEERALRMLIV